MDSDLIESLADESTTAIVNKVNEEPTKFSSDLEPLEFSIESPSSEIECSKRTEIIAWLKNSLSLPDMEFEHNESVLSILHKLMQYTKQREVDTAQVIANFKVKRNEYEMEGKRYDTLIKRLGIEQQHLDTDFQTSLDTLAQINLILDLKTPTNANFLLAVNHLQDTMFKLEDEIDSEMKLVSRYQKKTQSALQKSYELQKILTLSKANVAILENDVSKQTKKIEFLPKKIQEYEQKLSILKDRLEQLGIKPEIRHDALVKRHKEVIKLTNEIKESQVTLDSFSNLPPDLIVIKQKIEEVRKELCEVDAALKAKITSLNY